VIFASPFNVTNGSTHITITVLVTTLLLFQALSTFRYSRLYVQVTLVLTVIPLVAPVIVPLPSLSSVHVAHDSV